MIIGITGTIGVGKSTTAQYFQKHGFVVIDCDALGHEILEKDSEVQQKLIGKYGQEIIGRNLKIDREKLAEIVFNQQQNIDELNLIIRPKLQQKVFALLAEYQQKHQQIVIEAAILKELELEDKVDTIIIIKAELDQIYQRLQRKYTQKQIVNIMNKQLLPKKYDFMINNKGTLADLQKNVDDIIYKINKL